MNSRVTTVGVCLERLRRINFAGDGGTQHSCALLPSPSAREANPTTSSCNCRQYMIVGPWLGKDRAEMKIEATRQRNRRELIDRAGVVLGTMWGVWSDEPCWRELDMFFLPFRFDATPSFEGYRPMFDALTQAYQARAARREARIKNPTPEPWRPQEDEAAPYRLQIMEAVRIRESDGEVWKPVSLSIDGDCGFFRVSRLHCQWNGSEWV